MLRLTIALAILLQAPAVWAVPVVGPYEYQVDGTLSIAGNPVCASAPCTETVNFAFRFQWVETGFEGLFQTNIIPGFTAITGVGPLGESWQTVEGRWESPYYLPMWDQAGTEIDLDMPNNTFTETPWIGPTFGAELYSCGTPVCVTDFLRVGLNSDGSAVPPYYGIFLSGTVQSTATAVPEEGTLGLLSSCLVGLALWQWKLLRGRALA